MTFVPIINYTTVVTRITCDFVTLVGVGVASVVW